MIHSVREWESLHQSQSVSNIARTASTPTTTPNATREHASQLSSFQNQPKPSNFIPPVTKENDTNQPSSSQGKPHPGKQNRIAFRAGIRSSITFHAIIINSYSQSQKQYEQKYLQQTETK